MKAKIGAVLGAVSTFLGLAGSVHAQTPTLTPISSDASQLLVNGVGSIQAALYAIVALIWPYVLGVMIFFLVIRFGMRFFKGGK
jgi:hypothetical protein